jgi:hypothetical protein
MVPQSYSQEGFSETHNVVLMVSEYLSNYVNRLGLCSKPESNFLQWTHLPKLQTSCISQNKTPFLMLPILAWPLFEPLKESSQTSTLLGLVANITCQLLPTDNALNTHKLESSCRWSVWIQRGCFCVRRRRPAEVVGQNVSCQLHVSHKRRPCLRIRCISSCKTKISSYYSSEQKK